MTQLIRKGGFRERANRSARFASSENQLTTLPNHQYSAVVENLNATETKTTMTMNAENQQQPCNKVNTEQK